jgi:two-component system, chemotaxis family, CheB/CheR fusion protein
MSPVAGGPLTITAAHDDAGVLRGPAGAASSATPPRAVVGIGASAGGLKALRLFFEAVPADSGMAYVVIMHLDRSRQSRIAEILQDRSTIPVTQVTEPTLVTADHVYVIPPDRDLEVEGGFIRPVQRADHRLHLPVDLFFRSLATEYGAHAAAVVLSGTGEDGAAGIRDVRAQGGLTMAQAPAEADHAGMPDAAIATEQVDVVLPCAEIPAELMQRCSAQARAAGSAALGTDAEMGELFAVLRERAGHDFSLYRRSTVLRRLERRLRHNEVATLAEYLPLLRSGETESRALVRDLLISVSGFFRDPEAFAALQAEIPALFAAKAAGEPVRVWVAGCATGEEAYSVAMLLGEHAASLENPPEIQIFATDIDEKGYASGRAALYPAAAVAGVAEERLQRFFTQEPDGFRVRKPLRETILFAVHNVLHDPPFAHLDLITCRNLLIYLQPEAQARVIETFHYALDPGGLLMLGASESAGDDACFTPVSKPHRIFRRDGAPRFTLPRPAVPQEARSGTEAQGDGPPRHRFAYGALHLRMLEEYAPPSLIVDERLDVVHLSAGAGQYLHMAGGKPSHNVIDLSRGNLRQELRAALGEAFEKGQPISRRVHLEEDAWRVVSLRVHPPVSDVTGEKFALVVFDESSAQDSDAPPAATAATPVDSDDELRRTREQLEATAAARDQTVQALQAAYEELQSASEEERAAAEELEASREEVQSINEELTTINQERQNTIEELKRTNGDLQNLIESSEIGTIFLDRSLRIRRFTPSVEPLFNFVASDQGRALSDITHRLSYPELLDDARTVLDTMERLEREVTSESGEWYIARINPYRSMDTDIEGLVITFFDITAQKRVAEEMRRARVVAEGANLSKGTFLSTLSHEFRTPLTGILGYADILSLDGPLTEAQVRKIDRIKAGCWHLAAMIDEILAFAQLDEGRDSAQMAPVDARQVAREAVALIEPGAEVKGLAVVVELPAEPLELVTDGRKLRQILINLCGNAVMYTERGEVRVRVSAEGGGVAFEVHDTGIGIAPEHQERIFERFWQVDGASTRAFGGLGIGLAAVRQYGELLGGRVGVDSVPGKGSSFRLWLPCNREED